MRFAIGSRPMIADASVLRVTRGREAASPAAVSTTEPRSTLTSPSAIASSQIVRRGHELRHASIVSA